MPNQVLCRANPDSRAERDQTGGTMRHNQSEFMKASSGASGRYRPKANLQHAEQIVEDVPKADIYERIRQ